MAQIDEASAVAILLICDEWTPMHGGISAFNRELAAALARQGHRVACLILTPPSPSELEDARACGVLLMAAERTPGGPELLVPARAALDFRPDVVIGHDRISGVAAWTYASRYLKARLVVIVHTAPSEIERYKSGEAATRRIEERERVIRLLAQDADVIAAVGPRLVRHTASVLLDHRGETPVLRLDPGMTCSTRPPTIPSRQLVLVLGRADDITVKGIDIAAGALAALPSRPPHARPGLLVRGAPSAMCDTLYAGLLANTGLSAEQLDIRPYTNEPGEILRDLVRATVCLMPSRAEGFGLAALEAIGAATPVRISARSGLAELLYELLGTMAKPMIVDVCDDRERNTTIWSEAVRHVLADPVRAFAYAAEVRERLAPQLSWQVAAAELMARLASA